MLCSECPATLTPSSLIHLASCGSHGRGSTHSVAWRREATAWRIVIWAPQLCPCPWICTASLATSLWPQFPLRPFTFGLVVVKGTFTFHCHVVISCSSPSFGEQATFGPWVACIFISLSWEFPVAQVGQLTSWQGRFIV